MLPTILNWEKTFIVSDEKTASLLSHGTHTINVLAPFLGQENNTRNASEESGIKLNVLAYWVHKFCAAGILIHTKTEKRRGSPVQYYRAIADEILVPTSLIASASDTELLTRVQQQEYEMFTANAVRAGRKFSPEWYLHYFRSELGQHWTMRPIENNDPVKILERPLHDWSHLDLAPTALKELRRELWALEAKYNALSGQGTKRKRVTLHLGLAEIS